MGGQLAAPHVPSAFRRLLEWRIAAESSAIVGRRCEYSATDAPSVMADGASASSNGDLRCVQLPHDLESPRLNAFWCTVADCPQRQTHRHRAWRL